MKLCNDVIDCRCDVMFSSNCCIRCSHIHADSYLFWIFWFGDNNDRRNPRSGAIHLFNDVKILLALQFIFNFQLSCVDDEKGCVDVVEQQGK